MLKWICKSPSFPIHDLQEIKWNAYPYIMKPRQTCYSTYICKIAVKGKNSTKCSYKCKNIKRCFSLKVNQLYCCLRLYKLLSVQKVFLLNTHVNKVNKTSSIKPWHTCASFHCHDFLVCMIVVFSTAFRRKMIR